MILITYSQDKDTRLWGFRIRRNGRTEAWSEHQYPTLRIMKKTVGQIMKVIKTNGSREEIQKIIDK